MCNKKRWVYAPDSTLNLVLKTERLSTFVPTLELVIHIEDLGVTFWDHWCFGW